MKGSPHRFVVLLVLVVVMSAAAGLGANGETVAVSYLGHSCFTVQGTDGPIIMIDPYASYVPYSALPQVADIVLMSHAHIDHCPPCAGETSRVAGDPLTVAAWDSSGRIRERDWQITDDVRVRFVEATHITRTGGGQGTVALFRFEIDGIRFAHFGDLGTVLTAAQVAALGDIDVLFLPVGGAFTIDATEALAVMAQIPSLRIVIPMHYNVEGITPWPSIAPLSDFADAAESLYPVLIMDSAHLEISPEALPKTVEVWVMPYVE